MIDTDQTDAARPIGAALHEISLATMLVLVLAGTEFVFWRRIQDRLNALRQIRFLAHHDALTVLPSRAFLDRLSFLLLRGGTLRSRTRLPPWPPGNVAASRVEQSLDDSGGRDRWRRSHDPRNGLNQRAFAVVARRRITLH